MSLLGTVLALFAGSQAAQAPAAAQALRYAEGQVWEYRTRPGDGESLLKIQKIAPLPGGDEEMLVYHVSVIGVDLGPKIARVLPHLPVAQEKLDASVTRLSSRTAEFPDPEEGIAEWTRAAGGVFNIAMAEIVALVEPTIAQAQAGE
jgi:hypothetical protein